MKQILVAITGASGVVFGIHLLERLGGCDGVKTHLVLSDAAVWNLQYEAGKTADEVAALADYVYPADQIWAAPASGSFRMDAMIVCPCSMRTLAAIKNGLADNLILRAADVAIKEGRKLILCPRETPLSAIHLDNMAYLAHLGVCILPPMPAFYQHPQTIDDLISHHTMKIFDQLGLPSANASRWAGGEMSRETNP